ncbi:hypothetical protein MHYP_G00217080 [Metynnis hypsauchen]
MEILCRGGRAVSLKDLCAEQSGVWIVYHRNRSHTWAKCGRWLGRSKVVCSNMTKNSRTKRCCSKAIQENSVQKKRAVILRGLPHFLREDPSKLLKTAETTESEEQMAKGVNIGILLIQEEEDVLDFSVVLEEQIVLNGIRDFPPHAVAMLVGLLFALNIDYPKELRYTFEVIQKVLLNTGGEQCSARVHGLRNRLLCKTL